MAGGLARFDDKFVGFDDEFVLSNDVVRLSRLISLAKRVVRFACRLPNALVPLVSGRLLSNDCILFTVDTLDTVVTLLIGPFDRSDGELTGGLLKLLKFPSAWPAGRTALRFDT